MKRKLLLLMLLMQQVLANTYDLPETSGRYVRVSLTAEDVQLVLAEVEVYSAGENVAISKTASQSSDLNANVAFQASTAVNFVTLSNTGSMTSVEDNPWWEVDLGSETVIDKVIIYEGAESLENLNLEILDESRTVVYEQTALPDLAKYSFFSKDLGDIWVIGDQMLLGDRDEDSTTSPRSALYDQLVAGGYSFNFTGHTNSNSEGLPVDDGYTYHSAVADSLLSDMTAAVATYWTQGRLATNKPDTVCIMLGSNDITNGFIENTTDRLEALLNAIYGLSGIGSPKVFLCSIPPNRIIEAQRTNTQIYNEKVTSVVTNFTAEGYDIAFVDLYQPLDDDFDNVMTDDNFHPNSTGSIIMSQQLVDTIEQTLILEDTDNEPMLFDGVRSTVAYAPDYHQYTVKVPGTNYQFTVIPPKSGVVHSSGKKPWLWRTIFYSQNIGNSIITDLELIDEGYYSVFASSSVIGHPDGNDRIKAIYDYLVTEHDFAPTFSASCMSRAAFMVFTYANAYPEQVECILMDNAVADGLAWPAGQVYAGHIEYAPGKFYSAPTAASSLQPYVDGYGLESLEAAAEFLRTQGSPIHQLEPLAEHCVPILSICGDSDGAVIYEENDARLQAKYQEMGGEMTVIVEDKGHSHGQKYAENTEFFLNFVRDNTFRQSCYSDFKTVRFDLGLGGSRLSGGALVQDLIGGRAATAPVVQAPEGYSFAGWDVSFDSVTEDMVVTAQYAAVEVESTAIGSETVPTVDSTDMGQTYYLSSSSTGSEALSTTHQNLFNGHINSQVYLTDGDTITVNFDTSEHIYGYDISEVSTHYGWSTAGGGRSNQSYEVIATYVDGTTSSIIADNVWVPNDPAQTWTQAVIRSTSDTPLARGVVSLQFLITAPANAGGVSVAREFDIYGTPATDTYVNGIPQSWLTANNQGANAEDTLLDTDGDGLNAVQEYRSGTDPNDSSSFLAISKVGYSDRNLDVSWKAISGKRYRIWHSADLSMNSWSLVASDVEATDTDESYTIPSEMGLSEQNEGFFILEVQ